MTTDESTERADRLTHHFAEASRWHRLGGDELYPSAVFGAISRGLQQRRSN